VVMASWQATRKVKIREGSWILDGRPWDHYVMQLIRYDKTEGCEKLASAINDHKDQ